jgi:hypothetical protein
MADRHELSAPIGHAGRSAALLATWGIVDSLPSRYASAVGRDGRPDREENTGDPADEKGKARWTWIAATRNLTPIAGECKRDRAGSVTAPDKPRCPPRQGARNNRWSRGPGLTRTMEMSGWLLAPPLLIVIELDPFWSERAMVEWSAPVK